MNQGNNTKYHKTLHIYRTSRMHGNVYINISTTIRNCSNNHCCTNEIVWENATCQVVTRLQEPETSTKAHNKRTADTKDYSEYLLPPRDEDNMTDISGRRRNVIPAPSRGQCNDGQERMSRDGANTGNQGKEDDAHQCSRFQRRWTSPCLSRHLWK